MKKLLTLIALLVGISTMAQAYTIYSVGSITTLEWNDLLDRTIDQEATVYAGVDPADKSKRSIEVHFDTGLTTLKMPLLHEDGDYDNFIYILNKAIEWAEVARTNGVDHRGDIGGCGIRLQTHCRAKFVATSDGQTSMLFLDLESVENMFYTQEAFIPIEEVVRLKQLIEVDAEEKIEELSDKKSTAGLFK